MVWLWCVLPIWAVTYTAPPDQVNLRIPPVGTGGSGDTNQDVTRSKIVISGFNTNQQISYFKLNLSLNHTYDGDLVITLIAPDGTPITLANRLGGSGSNYVNTTFDDEAGRSISSGQVPFSGYFQPAQLFGFGVLFQSNSIPNNGLPNGTWTIQVEDRGAGDTGTLLNWSLTFVLQPVVELNSRNTLWMNHGTGLQNSYGLTTDTFLGPRPGRVFYANGTHLYAFSTATGTFSWSAQTMLPSIFNFPAAALLPDGLGGYAEWVFVTTEDGFLNKFNAQDGSSNGSANLKRGACNADRFSIAPVVQQWNLSDVAFRTQFVDGDSLVFVGTQDGCGDTSNNRILAFRASNLDRVWTFNGDGSYDVNAITGMTLDYARNTLYATTISSGGQTSVFALSTTGAISATLRWSFNAGTVNVSPVLGDGCIYVAGANGFLHKLNADTGAEIWSIPMTNGLGLRAADFLLEPAFDPIRNMLFVSDGSHMVGFKDQGGQAALTWDRNAAQSDCEDITAPTVFEALVAASDLGKFYVLASQGFVVQYDIAGRTIEVETSLNVTNVSDVTEKLIPDSDNGGSTVNRLIGFGQDSNMGRFCIPWTPHGRIIAFANAPTNDLAISISSISPPLNQGAALANQPLTYVLAVTNRGPSDVGGTTVGDVFPPGLAFVSASASQGYCSCSGNAFTAGLGTLTNGASATVTLTVLPTVSGVLTHTATVAADFSYDPVPTNNTVDLSFIADAILSISDSSVLEPNIGTSFMVFTVSLGGPYYQPVSVNYSTSDLSAQAGLDYLSTNGTLIFNPGETSKTISVPVMADTTISGNETFELNLSYPTNAVLLFNHYTAVGTIIDDDGPILLNIALAGTNVLLSWSTNIEGFTLETSYDLSSGTWNQVFAPVGVVGNQNVVTNSVLPSPQFYRLRKYNGPPQ
jgi:uncharacterized repeat protein (TIGR01451 family)